MTRPSSGPWAHPPRRRSRAPHVIVWLAGFWIVTVAALVVWALT